MVHDLWLFDSCWPIKLPTKFNFGCFFLFRFLGHSRSNANHCIITRLTSVFPTVPFSNSLYFSDWSKFGEMTFQKPPLYWTLRSSYETLWWCLPFAYRWTYNCTKGGRYEKRRPGRPGRYDSIDLLWNIFPWYHLNNFMSNLFIF